MRQFSNFALISILLLTSACNVLEKKQSPSTSGNTQIKSAPASELITSPTKQDKLFTQTALTKLGFKLGKPDGIWGKRSVNALNSFHKKHSLAFTNGMLSRLGMQKLEQLTQLRHRDFRVTSSLLEKLDSNTPLSKGPQLIILDKQYAMLAKANPFSEVLLKLEEGTGIYIVSHQLGWIEVESLDRQKGFIKDH